MIDFQNGNVFKLKRDSDDHGKELSQLLIPGETVIGTYTSVRDYIAFTDKRIITVNKQGMTGTRRDFTSLPYSHVSAYSVETAGVLGYDGELELFFPGIGKVRFEFSGSSDILTIGQAISLFVLK